jgi:dihydropteroate synthase
MKIFKRESSDTKTRIPQIAPTSSLDVSAFQESTISVSAEIIRHPLASGPFSNRESRLRVKITNEGEKEIENLSVEAIAPEGTLLVDPGILFGTTRRHVRLPRLLPTKSVTYKLGIRAREGFSSGVLVIEIRENFMHSRNSQFQVKIGLTSQ